MKLRLLFASFCFSLSGTTQDVEVVIASGLDYAQCVAFSGDNRFIAKSLMTTCSIWDVHTGRMIRKVAYSGDAMSVTDSIWFSDDNTKLVVGLVSSNDKYEIEIASGEVEKIPGPPMNWQDYKYVTRTHLISTSHLYGKSMEDLVYPSPDQQKELIYHKVKSPYTNNNLLPYVYQVMLRLNGELLPVLDSAYSASFAFSQDSKYLLAEQSIYDLETGRKVTDLKTVPYSASSVMFKPGTHIPVTAGVNTLRTWEFPDISDIYVKDLGNFKPAANNSFLVCEKYNSQDLSKTFVTIDLATGAVTDLPVKSTKSSYILDISADGRFFCFLEMDLKPNNQMVSYNIHIHDTQNGKLVKTIDNATKAFFTADNGVLITDSLGAKSYKYSTSGGKPGRFPTDGVSENTVITNISNDHQFLIGYTLEMTEDLTYQAQVNAWDSKSGKKIFETHMPGLMITGAQVSPDHNLIAFADSYENVILVYDLNTGKKVYDLKGHLALIEQTAFSDDSKRLISSSMDGTRRIWNLEKGTEMVSLISTGERDYAIVTPKKYYYATKGAQKLIHFVQGTEIFPFAQFDLKYNRPDIVIESLEAWNQSLVEPFNLAYQKRLARMGFTEEMLDGNFHLPTISLVNSEPLPLSTKSRVLSLDLVASDDRHNLDRILIRVNEVPVDGIGGISLRETSTRKIGRQVDIQLSQGHNQIAITVMNEKGVESIAENITIEYLPDGAKKPDLHLVTIGVSKYAQSNYDLSFASKDAADIRNLLVQPNTVFETVHTYHLTDKDVTVAKLTALKTELAKTSVDDAVCVFYAGHGVLDQDLNYFLASHEMDFTNPVEKGIPYEVIEGLVSDIPARKKLILIDACHSGEIDKESVMLVENTSVQTEEELTFRAITTTTVQQVGLTNSFELMKELFTDVRKSSGAMIISSAGGMEYAIEGAQWNNGVFTYCLLNGIAGKKADLNQDGFLMLSEINLYVRDEVYRITNGRQQPTTRAEVTDADWRLW
jgi:WD40 repeat protein